MGAVTSKVVMYKQVLLLVGLVFLSTSVRSHPVKPAADKEAADTAAEKAPEAAADESAAPSPADAEKGEAPVEETGDAAAAPSEGDGAAGSNMVSPKKLDEAINAMNELNDKFEKIVQSISPESNGGDAVEAAGDADAADGEAADAAADADGAVADAAADADGEAADAAADADAAPADGTADAATDAKADAKKV